MASRANHRVLLGYALLCAAALLCSETPAQSASDGQPASPAAASNFPVATDARLAGDSKQTRFVLDDQNMIGPLRHQPFAHPFPQRLQRVTQLSRPLDGFVD